MISKANGTATCDCGHIPNDHSAAVPPSKRERWVDGRTKPTRPMKTAEHWQAVMRYCNTRYDKARMRVHRREKAWREQNPNWRDLMRDGKRPNFYDDAYHFWASLPYQFKKRFTEQVDVPGVRAGCFKCKSEGRVCMNSPAQARAAGKRRAKEAGLR